MIAYDIKHQMDVYPLADAPPPRYAVESDDEDEYNTFRSVQHTEVIVEFKSTHDIPSGRPLVFASGQGGLSWANIANLGEQRAGIYVNKLPVGLLFLPSWTNAVIVVSEIETRTRLPIFAMTAYTTAIIERLQPTSVAILDHYPTQVYVSPRVISQDRSPLRYLSVGKKPVPDSDLEPFAPPNLLHSTTASLLNELFLRSLREDSTRDATAQAIILLPSLKVSLPPSTFDAKGSTGESFSESESNRETVEKAHGWLFAIIGEEVDGSSSLRSPAELGVGHPGSVSKTRVGLGGVGDGGMYI